MKLSIEPTYKLVIPNSQQLDILLIGCGGTGGYAAGHVAQLAWNAKTQNMPVPQITFMDGDKIEEKNIQRQPFGRADIGQNKAENLARRLNAAYGLSIQAIPCYADEQLLQDYYNNHRERANTGRIMIGAVDNHHARIAMTKTMNVYNRPHLYIDAGNDRESGQVVAGTTNEIKKLKGALGIHPFANGLPTIAILYPDLLKPAPEQIQPIDCATAMQQGDQGPVINKEMAIIIAQYIKQIIQEQGITTFWTSTNLKNLSRVSHGITASNLAKATGLTQNTLTKIQSNRRAA